MSALTGIFRQRCDAILRRWVGDPLIAVQVEAPAALGRLADLDVASEVGGVGQRSQGNVVAVRSGGGDPVAGASVWVRATYTGYRAAFVAFLTQTCGVQATDRDLAGFDIDHLLNRKRSPGGQTFLRLEAIPSDVNQAWGRVFEKAASDPGFYANQERTRRTLSWPIAAKLAWLAPPATFGDEAGIARVATGLAQYGLNPQEAVQGLRSMFDFAARRPA